MPVGRDQARSKDSALILARQGTTCTVQALQLAHLGEAYSFPLPKGQKPSLMAQGPVLTQRIPVNISDE